MYLKVQIRTKSSHQQLACCAIFHISNYKPILPQRTMRPTTPIPPPTHKKKPHRSIICSSVFLANFCSIFSQLNILFQLIHCTTEARNPTFSKCLRETFVKYTSFRAHNMKASKAVFPAQNLR